jgi:PAS domain S-box-containing protein
MSSRRIVVAYLLAIVVAPLLMLSAWLAYGDPCPILVVPVILTATHLGGVYPGLLTTASAIAGALLPGFTALDVLRSIVLVSIGIVAALCVRRFRDMTHEAKVTATEVAETQASAKVSHERFAQLANAIREVFWMTNVEQTQMLYVSPSYETLWGRKARQADESTEGWIECIYPADRERIVAAWQADRFNFNAEYRIVRPDGTVRWIHNKASPVRDDNGTLIAVAGIADDITDRRELEAQLRQTQKLESLGLLAGGVAHDFNNILNVITANANMLCEDLPEGHAHRELVDEIDSAVFRAAALTRQLLAFSRKQVTDPVVLDLNHSIAETRKMLRRLVGEAIPVRTSLDPDLGCVRIDPHALVQVLMNLSVNARDAMPEGGTLTIATRNVNAHELELSVSDTGCGMSREVLARVFEPFFTTKPTGKGTGLGLPVVHGIVQQAGGRIEIESEVGAGTTFKILLPIIDAPADPILDRVAIAARGQEKIVLVEDDGYVRAAASRALRARGYTVLEASEGRSALRLLRDHKRDVRLLVTDIVMPGMNGRELAEMARERMPELRVLFMSGYADDNDLRRNVEHAGAHFIEKPFRIQAFAAQVRQVLDETGGSEAELEWRDSVAHMTQPLCERELDKAAAKPALASLVNAVF